MHLWTYKKQVHGLDLSSKDPPTLINKITSMIGTMHESMESMSVII